MKHQKVSINTDNGTAVLAQAPLIVSASRATDIPAFYADWFFRRLEKGYVRWRNPFSGCDSFVSFAKTVESTSKCKISDYPEENVFRGIEIEFFTRPTVNFALEY